MFTCGSDDQYQLQEYANLAHSAHADGRRRRGPRAHVDAATFGNDANNSPDLEVIMLARAFLVAITALLLSGCVDSERFRENFGPRDYDRTERVPSK